MKSDLDNIMLQKNLDAILVVGNAEHNPCMFYFTGGGHVSHATLIKKRGEEPVIFCGDMEREEAAKNGLKVVLYSRYDNPELYKNVEGNPNLRRAIRYRAMLNDAGISKGRVEICGIYDVGPMIALANGLHEVMPELELATEDMENSAVVRAMETKSADEAERIRRMGKITTTVVGRVQEYLTNSNVREDEVLLKEDGTPLTIADVKAKINLWLAEFGVENPDGCIFSIGRDAGVPHSIGNPTDEIRLGRTIIFDIFPCEPGGGYFYDFTRTWSLGYADPEAQSLYEQVKEVYNKVVDNLDVNAMFKGYHRMACEYFEAHGHKSQLNTPAPLDGYMHGLGHGFGLYIHERPSSHLNRPDDHILKPGAVFTIEPGLYYPEKGMGVRIEDSFWVNPNGNIERLAEYPYDFVLKMKKWKK